MFDNLASSGPSAGSELQNCTLCTAPARYKCPRCAIPTCSLPCSRKHKEDTRCTGERDRAHYVPMNTYDWGAMMRDYSYLEEVGRKVSEWGKEIVRGGYMDNVGASAQKSSSGRKLTAGKSKREILRAHLGALDIDVELLPAGMERRNLNRSTLDQKSKCSLLTIEFVFHPPTTLTSPSPPSYKILSHRNSLSATLLTLLQCQVSSTLSKSLKQKENIPDWLSPLVTPHPEAPECFVPPHCYIRANGEFLHVPSAMHYHQLEPTLGLGELLQKTYFIEFPTIHVFDAEASSFCGIVIDKSGSIIRTVLEDDQVNAARAAKRRKPNQTMGLKAVFSLIGGYGSEGSSHSDEETAIKHLTGLGALEAYSRSDVDPTCTDAEGEGPSLDSEDSASTEGNQLDPPRLLEFVQQARSVAGEGTLDRKDKWDIDTEEQMLDAEL